MNENLFNELNQINVNEKVEEREGLKYLSWSYAWTEFKKRCPEAIYEIKMFDGKPYIYDEALGYMVMTEVFANGETLQCWLPVMDSKNKAMKNKPYEYSTKYGNKTVAAATMFDINKTIMRCLVKNIAMFGLGLYIYAGEDLPEVVDEQTKKEDVYTSLSDKIRNCKNKKELETLYRNNKTQICANKDLLDLVTQVGSKLKAA